MAQPPGYPAYPGYPQAGAPGYPPTTGYPPTSGAPGYPPEFAPPGSAYPPQPAAYGYPPQSSYPPQPGASPYPQVGVSAYPPQPGASPYPPQAGYPPPAGGSPYPPPAGGSPYPAAPGGYPPQTSAPGYPPQAAGYPAQPGYGYAPQATAAYPTQAYPGAVPAAQFPQAPIQPQMAYQSQMAVPGAVPGAMPMQGNYVMPRTDAGSVFPAPNFNVERDCESLRQAMKGLGTNEKVIIEVLAHRCNAQRQEILKKYKTMYGKDLIKELRSELTGNFEHTVISLMLTPAEFRAKEMRDAMKGTGTNEEALIQVLCTASNQMIRDTREAYKRMYERDLEKDLEKETSGHFKRLLISCANASRNENAYVDMAKAQTLAEQLYHAGAAKMGTDETGFLRVLANESFPQLQAVFDTYRQRYGTTIEEVLKKEMSGDLLRGFLAIVRCVISPPYYYAKTLHDAMAGAGTRDHELVRVVVMRSEVDMQLIKQEFQRQFGKALSHVITNDTSGDYKKVLVALVGA